MLFNLFSKTPTQEELYKKSTQQELKEEAAEKEVSIKLFRERLEKIRKEFQKEILELTA